MPGRMVGAARIALALAAAVMEEHQIGPRVQRFSWASGTAATGRAFNIELASFFIW